LGFKIIYKKNIDTKRELNTLEEKYDAIFIGIGSGPTRSLKIEGEEKDNVVGAVEWIEQLRMKHHQLKVPNRVIVIGGGNTAMDAASEAARMGAEEVILAYRRDRKSMGAYSFEYDTAINGGVNSLFNVQPVEILGNGKATAVKFVRTKQVNGKLKTEDDSDFVVQCDLIIKATGQAKHLDLLTKIEDLTLDEKKRVVVSEKTFQTTNPKYFAGGDTINGGAEVVNACYDGKMAAHGILKWLT
jgi:glutamate synthase (NADPH/NADH) small chain